MYNKLTVIIPFLNEGVEVEHTVKSIRETAKDKVNILLLNDNSTDAFDYESIALKYNAEYHKNKIRQGVARSRDIGVSLIKTPFFLLIDGHMRFYDNNWWNVFVNHLEKNDRAVYSGRCLDLDSHGMIKNHNQSAFGAFINFENCIPSQVLEPTWITINHEPNKAITEIPCILGASYALSVKYWNHIHGLEGLRYYGNDESYLSLKIWLEGGKCFLLKDIKIGHIFREEAPYKMLSGDRVYNKVFIARMLLPERCREKIEECIKRIYPSEYNVAEAMLRRTTNELEITKKKYKKIFVAPLDVFLDLNKNEDYHVSFESKLANRMREIATYISRPSQKVGLMTGEIGEIIFLYEYAFKQKSIFYKKQADCKMEAYLENVSNNISHYNLYSGAAGIGIGLKYLCEKKYIDFDWRFFISDMEEPMEKYLKKLLDKNNMGFMQGAVGIAYYFLESGVNVIDDRFLSGLYQYGEKNEYTMKNGLVGVLSFLMNCKDKIANTSVMELIKLYTDILSSSTSENGLCYKYGDLITSYILYKAGKILKRKSLSDGHYKRLVDTCHRRDMILEGVNDASIYSGSAGTSLIYFLMDRYGENDNFVSAYKYWLDDISYKSNNIDNELWASSEYQAYNRGLLHGSAGIGLSILSMISKEKPAWINWIGL